MPCLTSRTLFDAFRNYDFAVIIDALALIKYCSTLRPAPTCESDGCSSRFDHFQAPSERIEAASRPGPQCNSYARIWPTPPHAPLAMNPFSHNRDKRDRDLGLLQEQRRFSLPQRVRAH